MSQTPDTKPKSGVQQPNNFYVGLAVMLLQLFAVGVAVVLLGDLYRWIAE